MKYGVVLLAAGSGKRMNLGRNKQFLQLAGEALLLHTMRVFARHRGCETIYLVINPAERADMTALIAGEQWSIPIELVDGGSERQYSVRNGLNAVQQPIVLVHDGARPFIDEEMIERLVAAAVEHGGAIAAVPVKDTIKRGANGLVVETVEREGLWSVQTPQAFQLPILCAAHEQAERDGYLGTDEASLVERLPHPVQLVLGSYENIKLTTPEDITFAEAILARRKQGE